MKSATVIWSCLCCEWWEWGLSDEHPEICPLCGGERFRQSRQEAIETLECMRYHEISG
jgi:hypothetical protein